MYNFDISEYQVRLNKTKEVMTIHVMPGIWTDTLGFECSEAIYITDKGCETFSKVSRQLFVK